MARRVCVFTPFLRLSSARALDLGDCVLGFAGLLRGPSSLVRSRPSDLNASKPRSGLGWRQSQARLREEILHDACDSIDHDKSTVDRPRFGLNCWKATIASYFQASNAFANTASPCEDF
jgi:hypothetical protein